jgi:hypothetical protein
MVVPSDGRIEPPATDRRPAGGGPSGQSARARVRGPNGACRRGPATADEARIDPSAPATPADPRRSRSTLSTRIGDPSAHQIRLDAVQRQGRTRSLSSNRGASRPAAGPGQKNGCLVGQTRRGVRSSLKWICGFVPGGRPPWRPEHARESRSGPQALVVMQLLEEGSG